MKISERIKELRGGQKLSQQQFADSLGVQKALVAHWETDRNNPKLENLIKICEVYNVSSDWILFGIDETKTSPTGSVGDVKKSGKKKEAIESSDISLRTLNKGQQLILQRLTDIEDFLHAISLNADTTQPESIAGKKGNSPSEVGDEHQKPRKRVTGTESRNQ